MTTTQTGWMPAPGDIVTFPAAPMEFNRSLDYEVLSVEGDNITFTAGRGGTYTYDAEKLRAIGMTLARHPEGVRG